MGKQVQPGTDFTSVLLATPDVGLQKQLREDLAQDKFAVLPLASLGEAVNAAVVLCFDRIILDSALCRRAQDLIEFTERLEPGQKLVLLHEPDRVFPVTSLSPSCPIRTVKRSRHPGIFLSRLRAALAGGSANPLGTLAPKNVSVLLVDPDPIAQDIILHNLLSQGYLVLNIPNPVEAAHTSQDIFFDVLMVDALLPLGGARKLANSLCGINPRLKVLFLSNHPREILTRSRVCPEGSLILGKPLRRREILEALDAVVKTGRDWKQLAEAVPQPS